MSLNGWGKLLFFILLLFSSFLINAGPLRNITSIDFEQRSNGMYIMTIEDAFILGLNQSLSLLLKPTTRLYPQLVTGNLESGFLFLWKKGVYSQLSYTIGIPLAPLISEWPQTRQSLYVDYTIERERDLFTTSLKANLTVDSYWFSHNIGYSYRFGILELWIRNTLSYDSLTLWMDSLWGELRWQLNEQWLLKTGTTLGTYKAESSPDLSGVEFSINTGFLMQVNTFKWGYLFTYTLTPDYSSQKHMLLADIQL